MQRICYCLDFVRNVKSPKSWRQIFAVNMVITKTSIVTIEFTSNWEGWVVHQHEFLLGIPGILLMLRKHMVMISFPYFFSLSVLAGEQKTPFHHIRHNRKRYLDYGTSHHTSFTNTVWNTPPHRENCPKNRLSRFSTYSSRQVQNSTIVCVLKMARSQEQRRRRAKVQFRSHTSVLVTQEY